MLLLYIHKLHSTNQPNPTQNPSSPSPMDLCCLPRSLTTLLPITRTHLRSTSLPKSLTSHFRPGFRAMASSSDASTFVPDLEKSPNESAKDGIGEAPFEFVSGEESPENSEAEEFVDKVNVKVTSLPKHLAPPELPCRSSSSRTALQIKLLKMPVFCCRFSSVVDSSNVFPYSRC